MRRAQRKVARRKRAATAGDKAVVLLQQAHAHVANQRNDFHHKAARALVDRFGLIAVEDLNVKGLAGSMLARSVHDAGWGMFLARLDDKAESAGRQSRAREPQRHHPTVQRVSDHGPEDAQSALA